MSFLKAAWRKLAIANYIIDKNLLTPYLPAGTELDLWQEKCMVSLVGFMFKNTKLLGVKIPFHTNFEEVNLRFYVRRFNQGEWKRGVVFIQEIVPKRALSFVANTIYHENYMTLPMEHTWATDHEKRTVAYRWKKAGKWNSFTIQAGLEMYPLVTNSETEFITEHYWGYARINNQRSNEYEVAHPRWDVYNIKSFDIDVDFKTVYGKEFECLQDAQPTSVMLAEGSEISVEMKRTITTTPQ